MVFKRCPLRGLVSVLGPVILTAACTAQAPTGVPAAAQPASPSVPGQPGTKWTDQQLQSAVAPVRAGRKLTPASWPNRAKVAVCLSFDVDNESFTLARGTTAPAVLSAGEFGAMAGLPRVLDVLDRNQIAALGLTVDQVESAFNSAYGSRQVSQIFAPEDQYQVIMQVAPKYQRDPAALSMLYIQTPGPNSNLIPLSTLVRTRQTVGPMSVNHTGQLPSVTLSFNLAPGVALGDAVARVQQTALQTLPGTISGSFQGTAQAFQDSMQGLGWVLALAIFVIYVVLGILYESFIHPLTILSGLPSAGFGALLTLLLFHQDLNIYAFVGVIMLVGLVKKNGIMMVDFAVEARRDKRASAEEAIYEACMVRFRPIMMTTMAALMGTIPIALGWGAGAEARRPLGLAVVGGLLVSQTLTLYVTPVFYVYMEKLQEQFARRRATAVQTATVPVTGEPTDGVVSGPSAVRSR